MESRHDNTSTKFCLCWKNSTNHEKLKCEFESTGGHGVTASKFRKVAKSK